MYGSRFHFRRCDDLGCRRRWWAHRRRLGRFQNRRRRRRRPLQRALRRPPGSGDGGGISTGAAASGSTEGGSGGGGGGATAGSGLMYVGVPTPTLGESPVSGATSMGVGGAGPVGALAVVTAASRHADDGSATVGVDMEGAVSQLVVSIAAYHATTLRQAS